VALRFLLQPEGLGGTPLILPLRREARAIAHLDHENIVRIFDVSELTGAPEEPSVPCLVMERLEGESLEALLRREKPLGLRRSLEIMSAVAAGLAHAHERGIVHRDLKPSNVFITRQGTVKLLDFGLAHLLAGGGSPLPHLPTAGTPSYMAPEQWRGEKQDARTDVWSAGVMLFEMLTGRQPYTNASQEVLRLRVLSPEPVPSVRARIPELPEEVEALVAAALAKDPQRRLPSAQELREQLRLLLHWWARAEQGEGGLVLITGEAGIGKSRLIQELRDRVSPESSVRLRCQCWSQFNNSSFYPIIEMLQHLFHLDPEGMPQQNQRALEVQLGKFGMAPERMALVASFLSLPIKENFPVLQLSPERQKERTFEALADLLLRIAREKPVLGGVEDLHWADPSTLTLLGYLMEKLEHSRVLLVLVVTTPRRDSTQDRTRGDGGPRHAKSHHPRARLRWIRCTGLVSILRRCHGGAGGQSLPGVRALLPQHAHGQRVDPCPDARKVAVQVTGSSGHPV